MNAAHIRPTPRHAARVAALAVLAAALLFGPGARLALAAEKAPVVAAVAGVSMTVADADRSIDFFTRVLDFEKVSDVEVAGDAYEHLEGVFGTRLRVVRLRLGDEFLDLQEFLAPRGRPVPVDSKSNDRWFQHVAIIVSDMDAAYARLRQHGVRHASSGPQTLPAWNKAAGGIKAFYFKDPDDHALEVLWFPAGKGDAKWQRRDGHLFLGIDHTAIVVRDTDASLRLYRDTLGLRVAGESENYGVEQEHLNEVFGARLRITGLRAAAGPGIEFLEYLAPSDGRPVPDDLRTNDLVSWQTRLVAADPGAAMAAVRQAGARLVSPGAVSLGDRALGYDRAMLVRDPDGHALLLTTDKSGRTGP
ncbi:MAG TPA: VOC family protein [Candidatus Polarisedimenticolia bacterium]|nr:VOC family protein [Candidatus Polarisedimenticolia bacterium]